MKLFKIILGAYLVFMVVLFMRCEKVTEVSELVKNTEKIQIVIYHDSSSDTYFDITEKKEISEFADFISDKNTPVYKCSYDGRIVFFMNDDVASGNKNSVGMDFSLKDGCEHIAYEYAGGLQTKELTDEGIDYLKKLLSAQKK
jgi:hypothetical protein